MSLVTARYLSDSRTTPLGFNTPVGWREIGKGLALVSRGYQALIAGGLLGAVLVWLAAGGWQRFARLRLNPEDREYLLPLATLVFGLTAAAAYALVLAGQWHCLRYAPHNR